METSSKSENSLLTGRRVLAVDDEHDVLEIIAEQLEETSLITASSYEMARDLIERGDLDLVILDIMGVRGFELLEHSRRQKIPAVMLTAHALSPESFQKSIDKGAISFLPKEQLYNLHELITEILEDVDSGRTHWQRLIGRLGPRLKEMWGVLWREIKFPDDPNIRW
jgi:DNA-binding NtrC family response regulator